MAERIAVFPGTFDPITLGHIDLIERSLKLFDKVIVAVTTNPSKKPFFSLQERVQLAKRSVSHLSGVQVESFKGLLVDYVKSRKASFVVRGLREVSDFTSEFQRATVNRKLAPSVETVFIMTSEKFFYLNSSIVKEIASLGGSISCFVPKHVEAALKKKLDR